jgi:lipopolysaccharide export system permease protein
VLAALMLLFAFFDVVQEMDTLGRKSYGLGELSLVVLLNMPGRLVEILPVAALIGVLLVLSRLVAQSEYAVMRVSGLSNWRLASWLGSIGLVLALLLLVASEYVAPWSEQAAQRVKLSATQSVIAQQFRSGLWVKDGEAFVNAREVLPDNSLRDVRIYDFDAAGRLRTLRAAREAQWQRGQEWTLTDVAETHFGDADIRVVRHAQQRWRTVLTPDMLAVLLIAPEKMSARSLYRYVAHLRANDQTSTRYELALWAKFINPLIIPVMMLIAIPFALTGPRARGASGKVFIGILVGLAFHLLSKLFGHLGLLNGWPAPLVASLPMAVFVALALLSVRWANRR